MTVNTETPWISFQRQLSTAGNQIEVLSDGKRSICTFERATGDSTYLLTKTNGNTFEVYSGLAAWRLPQ